MNRYVFIRAVCVVFALCACIASAVDPPNGTYFESRTGSALVFTPSENGGVKAEILPAEPVVPIIVPITAEMKDDRLYMTDYVYSWGEAGSSGQVPCNHLVVFAASTEHPGDWNLVAASDPYGINSMDPAEIKPPLPLISAIPGYLHPIGIEGEKYFLLLDESIRAKQKIDQKALVDAALELLSVDERDPARRVIVLDALLHAGRMQELRDRFTAWEGGLGSEQNPDYPNAALICCHAIAAWELSKLGQNGFDAVERVLDPATDLEHRRKLVLNILEYSKAIPYETGIYRKNWNFLNALIFAKVMIVESQFDLLRGDRELALRREASVYHMGQDYENGAMTMSQLVGVGVRLMAAKELQLHVLNACETEEELRRASAMPTELEHDDPQLSEADLEKRFPNGLQSPYDPPREVKKNRVLGPYDFPLEANNSPILRTLTADADFWLAKSLVGARYTKMKTKKWPTSPADFYPLGETPPLDPFNSKPFLYAERGKGFAIWSVGLDRDDDSGLIEYDPTNGVPSDGDIVTMIGAERRYPFPAAGFHPKAPVEVPAKFPDGLPVDGFADHRDRPLTLSVDYPPRIFSFGPDLDELTKGRDIPPGRSQWEKVTFPLQAQYDPTNGIRSAGNLYYEPPR